MGRKMCFTALFVAIAVFGVMTFAVAEEFYITKDAAGKTTVVTAKPADAKAVVKGPFKTKEEAEKAMKAAATAPKIVPPDQGC